MTEVTTLSTQADAWIFDVDGVLLASPHERTWREALRGIVGPDRFTTALHQAQVAGRPRLDEARAALIALGLPEAEQIAATCADAKQRRLENEMDAVIDHILSRKLDEVRGSQRTGDFSCWTSPRVPRRVA